MSNSVIVIPARYNSTRFPGKPLIQIAGKTMLQRVYEIAVDAASAVADTKVVIATDDARIEQHGRELGAQVVITPVDCATGSDRALAAAALLSSQPQIVINLQGDAPLTPPSFVEAILKTLINNPDVDVATPVNQLTWEELDYFKERKKLIPFSGTTAVVSENGRALWFSKQIIPAIRDEEKLRAQSSLSPVYRHIGLYGYRFNSLKKFVSLDVGKYEELEGLEQLRMLENGMNIHAVKVRFEGKPNFVGVDTLEDAKKTEQLILESES